MIESIGEPQLRLLEVPLVGLYPCSIDTANTCLIRWGHKLGACKRPFRSEAFGLELDGQVIAIAISASIVSDHIAGYQRDEVVELARLAAANGWANRIMLRLWREVCAPRWQCWPVKAAVSYSHNAMHSGDLYRFDGWEKNRCDAGSSGGGTWSKKRDKSETVYGKKSLWLWKYS
jgi:antitoxin VapB